MAIISRPHSARIRFIDADEATVQTFGRIHPELQVAEVHAVRQAINNIRRASQSATGGFYTVMDELVEE